MRARWLVVALALLLLGADWNTSAGGDTACPQTLKIGATCFHDFAATTAPASVNVSQCDHVNISLNPDNDGTATGAEIQVYDCETSSYSANTCQKVLADTDGDGVVNDVTLDGSTLMRRGIWGFTAEWLAVQITANPNPDTGRITLRCRG